MTLLTNRYNALTTYFRCTLPLLVRMWLLVVVAMSFYAGPVLAQPANDNFPGQALPATASGSLAFPGSNVGATAEDGELPHIYGPYASVWYSWTAPTTDSQGNSYSTAAVTFETAGSNFDTLLEVYEGIGSPAALTGLSSLGANDDVDYGSGDRTSRVTFTATAGTTYYIVVDGYSGATGKIQLQWDLVAEPTNFLWAWGSNRNGQLGATNINDSSVPLLVHNAGNGPLNGLISISAGIAHTLALKNDGTVWAWGENYYGQLGNNSTTNSYVPVQVVNGDGTPLANVKAISAGSVHNLVLKNDGTVWAWGNSDDGELGDGSNLSRLVPVQVLDHNLNALTDVQAISAGGNHNLSLKNDGTVWAWGGNEGGQIGDNTSAPRYLATEVVDNSGAAWSDVKNIAAGSYSSMAVKNDGTLWAWGWTNGPEDSSVPIQVVDGNGAAIGDVKAVAAGDIHSLFLKNDGTVWAWGYNSSGQLGNDSHEQSPVPIHVLDNNGGFLTGVQTIEAGTYYSLALKNDGTVWAWGANGDGQLGDNSDTYNSFNGSDGLVAAQVRSLAEASLITAGGSSSFALASQAVIAPVARNDTANTLKNTPVRIVVLANDVDGDGEPLHIESVDIPVNGGSATLNDDSILYAPPAGYLGKDSFTYNLQDGQGHSATATVTVSINDKGNAVAWGWNNLGQLGNNSTVDSSTPVSVADLASATQLAAGGQHSLALLKDGTVSAWGSNYMGQLGNNSIDDSYGPVQVVDGNGGVFNGVKAIAADGAHSLALKNDGTVWAWGSNFSGELGNSTMTYSSVPLQIMDSTGNPLINVHAIAAAGSSHFAVTDNGEVWAWGENDGGQLGNHSTDDSYVPVRVLDSSSNPLTNVMSVYGGIRHAIALKNDGTVWAWGKNSDGQLGVNSTIDSLVPMQVVDENGDPLEDVQAIDAGGLHSLALKNDGTVWIWGGYYSVAGGKNLAAVQVVDAEGVPLSEVQSISSGLDHTFSLKSDGSIWAWGFNAFGQLGNNSNINSLLPVQVQNLSGIKSIAAGSYHCLGLHGSWTGDDDAADGLPGSNGNWHTAGNWASDAVPAANEAAIIVKPGTYEVILDNDAGAGSMVLGSADLAMGNPSLDLSGNTLTLSNKAQVNPSGIVTGNGTVDGDMTLEGHIHPSIQSGTSGLSVRNHTPAGAGNINITRDVKTKALASIDIDIAGREDGQHGVVGAADWQLDGTLNVELKNNFVPAVDEKIELLRWKTKSGAFRSVRLPQVPSLKMKLEEVSNFNVNLPGRENYTGTTSLVLAVSAEAPPQLTITNSSIIVPEGNSGTSSAKFIVTLSPVSTQDVKVNYATSNGTAKAPADYTAKTGTLTIAAGESSGTIDVPIVGDLLDESNETFSLTLSNAVGATLPTNPIVTCTITDDDNVPSVSIANKSVTEGDSGTLNATFTVVLSAISGKTVKVNYATADGTAKQPADYTTTSGTLTIAAGQSSGTINVPIVGDVLDEANESFTLTLSSPVNATLAVTQALGTITDNDPLPSLTISNRTVTEGDSGTTTTANFTVTLSAVSGRDVTVKYATVDGTAKQPADYTSTNGSLTFSAGQTSKTISVPVLGDVLDEASESFTVTLTNPVNASIASAQGLGTITDNDATPTLSIANRTLVEGDTGSLNANFTVTLSVASGRTVTVNYATADGTAKQPADYTQTSGTLTFSAGQTVKSIAVPVIGDLLDEENETFFVNLSAPTNGTAMNATLANAQGLGTINDNDVTPTLTIVDKVVTEGNSGSNPTTNCVFTVTLSAASGRTVTVNYATSNGSALASTSTQIGDYTRTTGSLTFTPGQISKTIAVPVIGDIVDEANESFTLALTGPLNATLADGSALGTITDDDGGLVPNLRLDDVSVIEGNRDTKTLSFTVTLSASSTQNVTVNYATANNSAVAGTTTSTPAQPGDYVAKSGTLTFTPGQTSKTIDVTINGDLTVEPDERFFVNLSGASGAVIADAQGIGTITTDDTMPRLMMNDVSVTEGSSSATSSGMVTATFTATLSQAWTQNVTVHYATANGIALAPGDYTATSGNLTFTPGQTSKTISVQVAGDLLDEVDEAFYVILSSPINASIYKGRGVGTILDNDAAPSITIENITVKEYNSGQTTAALRLKLSAPSGQVVKVSYATANGITNPATGGSTTITTGSDYISVAPTQVAFTTGSVYAYARVLINGDLLPEANESFLVNLSSPLNATIADNQGVGTILNDDSAPSLTINDVSISEGNSGTKLLSFTVTLSKASGQTVSVKYATADGIARSTSDYVAKNGTLSFSAGQVSKTISVVINGDVVVEGNETLYLLLSGATNASIGRARGTATILNDDNSS